MVRTFAAAVLAGGAFVSPALAQLQPAPAAAAQPLHVLPFELYDGRIYVQASVAGSGPRTFLVDTGAQLTHLSAELVVETGLETFGGVTIMGTGRGEVQGRYVRPGTIDIGGMQLQVETALSAPSAALFGPVVTSSGKRFDGIIGYDLFAAFVVEIDYLARVIRLHDASYYAPPQGADVVPISVVDNKPYVIATIGLGGQEVEATLHLDTGSGGAIGLNGDFVEERNLLAMAGPTLASMSRGVGGVTAVRLGRAQSLTLGRTVLSGPFITYALAQGRGVAEHSAGRIGGAILRRFTLAINYPARTVSLQPNANFDRPLETDMSGLALVSREGGVHVFGVEKASAADEAGIRPGDRLISIDGQPAQTLSLDAIRAMLMQHGAVRSLVLLRNGRSLDRPVRLRRRI